MGSCDNVPAVLEKGQGKENGLCRYKSRSCMSSEKSSALYVNGATHWRQLREAETDSCEKRSSVLRIKLGGRRKCRGKEAPRESTNNGLFASPSSQMTLRLQDSFTMIGAGNHAVRRSTGIREVGSNCEQHCHGESLRPAFCTVTDTGSCKRVKPVSPNEYQAGKSSEENSREIPFLLFDPQGQLYDNHDGLLGLETPLHEIEAMVRKSLSRRLASFSEQRVSDKVAEQADQQLECKNLQDNRLQMFLALSPVRWIFDQIGGKKGKNKDSLSRNKSTLNKRHKSSATKRKALSKSKATSVLKNTFRDGQVREKSSRILLSSSPSLNTYTTQQILLQEPPENVENLVKLISGGRSKNGRKYLTEAWRKVQSMKQFPLRYRNPDRSGCLDEKFGSRFENPDYYEDLSGQVSQSCTGQTPARMDDGDLYDFFSPPAEPYGTLPYSPPKEYSPHQSGVENHRSAVRQYPYPPDSRRVSRAGQGQGQNQDQALIQSNFARRMQLCQEACDLMCNPRQAPQGAMGYPQQQGMNFPQQGMGFPQQQGMFPPPQQRMASPQGPQQQRMPSPQTFGCDMKPRAMMNPQQPGMGNSPQQGMFSPQRMPQAMGPQQQGMMNPQSMNPQACDPQQLLGMTNPQQQGMINPQRQGMMNPQSMNAQNSQAVACDPQLGVMYPRQQGVMNLQSVNPQVTNCEPQQQGMMNPQQQSDPQQQGMMNQQQQQGTMNVQQGAASSSAMSSPVKLKKAVVNCEWEENARPDSDMLYPGSMISCYDADRNCFVPIDELGSKKAWCCIFDPSKPANPNAKTYYRIKKTVDKNGQQLNAFVPVGGSDVVCPIDMDMQEGVTEAAVIKYLMMRSELCGAENRLDGGMSQGDSSSEDSCSSGELSNDVDLVCGMRARQTESFFVEMMAPDIQVTKDVKSQCSSLNIDGSEQTSVDSGFPKILTPAVRRNVAEREQSGRITARPCLPRTDMSTQASFGFIQVKPDPLQECEVGNLVRQERGPWNSQQLPGSCFKPAVMQDVPVSMQEKITQTTDLVNKSSSVSDLKDFGAIDGISDCWVNGDAERLKDCDLSCVTGLSSKTPLTKSFRSPETLQDDPKYRMTESPQNPQVSNASKDNVLYGIPQEMKIEAVYPIDLSCEENDILRDLPASFKLKGMFIAVVGTAPSTLTASTDSRVNPFVTSDVLNVRTTMPSLFERWRSGGQAMSFGNYDNYDHRSEGFREWMTRCLASNHLRQRAPTMMPHVSGLSLNNRTTVATSVDDFEEEDDPSARIRHVPPPHRRPHHPVARGHALRAERPRHRPSNPSLCIPPPRCVHLSRQEVELLAHYPELLYTTRAGNSLSGLRQLNRSASVPRSSATSTSDTLNSPAMAQNVFKTTATLEKRSYLYQTYGNDTPKAPSFVPVKTVQKNQQRNFCSGGRGMARNTEKPVASFYPGLTQSLIEIKTESKYPPPRELKLGEHRYQLVMDSSSEFPPTGNATRGNKFSKTVLLREKCRKFKPVVAKSDPVFIFNAELSDEENKIANPCYLTSTVTVETGSVSDLRKTEKKSHRSRDLSARSSRSYRKENPNKTSLRSKLSKPHQQREECGSQSPRYIVEALMGSTCDGSAAAAPGNRKLSGNTRESRRNYSRQTNKGIQGSFKVPSEKEKSQFLLLTLDKRTMSACLRRTSMAVMKCPRTGSDEFVLKDSTSLAESIFHGLSPSGEDYFEDSATNGLHCPRNVMYQSAGSSPANGSSNMGARI